MKQTVSAFQLRCFSFRFFALFVALAVTVAIGAMPATAQVDTGTISGTITDPSGAVVPDAAVSLTSQGTGAVKKQNTTNTGGFRFALLTPGKYNLEVAKTGFRKIDVAGVEVTSNSENAVGALKLQLGDVSESVEVSAAPPLVESAQAQVSTAITGEALQTFAGIGENEGADFVALTLPGVAASRDNNFSNTNGVGFSVDGLRGRSNDQQIDGQNNNDNSVTGPQIFMADTDFINEYQATTSNFGPEYGRNSGSVINVVTKNGTNHWHGTVFGQETNSVLTALTNEEKDFDGITRPPRFNQEFTGGSIGGPLLKNKVFVFGGFDNQIFSSKFVFGGGGVTPTSVGVGELAGCFPGSAGVAALAAFGPFAIGGGSPTSAPGTTTTLYSDGAPVNNTTDPATGKAACGYQVSGIQRTLGDGSHEYDFVSRLDVHATDADSFYIRYLFQKEVFFNANFFTGQNASGYPVNVPSLGQSGLVDWTHTLSSRMLNELRVGYQRNAVQFGGNTIGTIPTTAGIATAPTTVGFQAPGLLGFGIPEGDFPQGRVVNTYQLQDNFSYTRGAHQLKWGANITNQRSPNVFLPGFNGSFSFGDYGGLAANTPAVTTLDVGNPNFGFHEWDTFFYVGDDWKVKSNLTLNLGLTYSYLGQPANIFHGETATTATSSTPVWNPHLPLSVTTTPTVPTVKDLFGPSIGFAWSPNGRLTGNGQTVLRGGYRLTYDPAFYNIFLLNAISAPVVLSQTFAPGPLGVPAGFTGNLVRSAYGPILPLGKLDPRNSPQFALSPTLSPDKVHEWSFGIQRNVTNNSAVEVRYVGNHGENLFQSVNLNPSIGGLAATFPNLIPAGLKPCTTPGFVGPDGTLATSPALGRINCNEGIQTEVGNTGYSNYNGLQAEFRTTNIFHQLTMRTNYTWSKTLDNTSDIFNTFGGGNSETYAQNPLDTQGPEYSLSGIDFPQTWTLSAVEDLPVMRSQHGVLGHIVGGWSVAGTYILQSGQPFTPQQEAISLASYAVTPSGAQPQDVGFNESFNNGVPDVVRPFIGSLSAPQTQVGIYAGDACAEAELGIVTAFAPACGLPGSELISLNDLNGGSTNGLNITALTKGVTGAVTPVTSSQVRLIANGAEADSIFGTPFGNARRGTLRDYHTNLGNFTLYKNFKFKERATLRWDMTMNNVFNHPNYGNTSPGVSTFIENAGAPGLFTTFGNPLAVSTGALSCPAGSRCIFFGLKVIY